MSFISKSTHAQKCAILALLEGSHATVESLQFPSYLLCVGGKNVKRDKKHTVLHTISVTVYLKFYKMNQNAFSGSINSIAVHHGLLN